MNETYSQVIAAPVARVWDLIDNHENLKLWMDGLEDTTYPDGLDRTRPVGTRFVQRIREGGRVAEYQGVVTAYERLQHLGIEIGNRAFTMGVDYRLTPVEHGTRLDYSAVMKRGGAFIRIMTTLFGWLTRKILRKQMDRLKAIAEAPATRAPG
jgi:carbon monoxide dehydrogenase subunit G